MKKSRYTEKQIAYELRQAEPGTAVAKVIRRISILEQTFYRWKKVYGGLGVGGGAQGSGEARQPPEGSYGVRQLEVENRKLKQLVADLSLDKHVPQDVLVKKL